MQSRGKTLNFRIKILVSLLYTTYPNPLTLQQKLLFSSNVWYAPRRARPQQGSSSPAKVTTQFMRFRRKAETKTKIYNVDI